MKIELHSFPCVFYFGAIVSGNELLLEAQENYNKRSYRNRFFLLSDKGIQAFTIPLKKGKHQQQNIRDVKISYDENWPDQLSRTLKTNYASSPYFDHYFPAIESIYRSGYEYLYDLNFSLLRHLLERLGINPSLSSSLDYEPPIGQTNDMRYLIIPRQEIEHDHYVQVFEDKTGFNSNLSILDLLFAQGPETKSFLKTAVFKSKIS